MRPRQMTPTHARVMTTSVQRIADYHPPHLRGTNIDRPSREIAGQRLGQQLPNVRVLHVRRRATASQKFVVGIYFCRRLLHSVSLNCLINHVCGLACLLLCSAHEDKAMYRNLLKTVVAAWLLGSFLLLSGCMLMLGGAAGYLIRKGEEGGSGGDTKNTTTSQSSKPVQQKTSTY